MQKQTLTQALQWKMTQKLSQSIGLLQMNATEIMNFVQDVAEENPLIETIDYPLGGKMHTSNVEVSEMTSNPPLSLYDQIKEQLVDHSLSDSMMKIVEYGIDNLNEDGYLSLSVDQWALDCGADHADISDALTLIQSVEPKGMGARDLTECLSLQLKAHYPEDDVALLLVKHHLDWVAQSNLEEICQTYGVSEDIALSSIDHIKRCHPKPGQLLSRPSIDYITPDAEVKQDDKGNWEIRIHHWNNPRFQLDPAYIQTDSFDKETRKYIKERRKQLDWLETSIQFRKLHLESVLELLLEKQRAFFDHGPSYVQALTLKDLAKDLDVHISTVSRLLRKKYVQTPHGTFSLQFFLQRSLMKEEGELVSSYSVKQRIKEIIHQEKRHKPFSDEKIRLQLQESYSIQISRRTVAKYREQMGILSSKYRKKRGN
ncbi:RNA polymerase factor sigma-54 [Radiobacillus kanasensis]|uniref:RNA polymerase factor sigma-54 n=1 Tax=Radiobacillus kanasensis TaxID=2844358 RepID=UPI001E41AACB|nr:RNA polymerase factor sigma-54 [Radiobacillus kanasensis]UFT98474.1 RNA polymerase factor sigma-54 [Radiobacillus kanasensis]